MVRPTSAQWRTEAALLVLAVVVAFATPPFFDIPPVNLLSVLFLALYVGSRLWEYRTRAAQRDS